MERPSDADRDGLRDAVFLALTDAQIEVRLLAGESLIGFMRGVCVVNGAERALRARCLKAGADAGGGGGGRRRRETPAATEDDGTSIDVSTRRHGAVLALSACVLSAPYDVPSWLPGTLETLASWSSDPSRHVKDTMRRTFSEFKKTHQDTWADTKAAFTAEQWDNVSIGMELAPSYIV